MRRITIIVIFTFQVLSSQAQNSKYPFQVIFANEAVLNSRRQLESLANLRSKDIITLSSSGTLSLIHESGYPLEFEGDTTLSVSVLDKFVRDNRKRTRFHFVRPKLELLTITTQDELQRALAVGRIYDWNHDLEIVYPPSTRITTTNGLCIVWRPSKSNSYKIRISNLYGDSLRTFFTSINELNLSKPDFDRLVIDSVALVQIADFDNKYSNVFTIIKSSAEDRLPYSCELENATTALCAALTMEALDEPFLEGAEEYYMIAVRLSGKPFYKIMLDNFKKRWNRK